MSCKVLAIVALTLLAAAVSGTHGVFVSAGTGFGPSLGFPPFGFPPFGFPPFGPFGFAGLPFGSGVSVGFGGPLGFGRHFSFGFGPGGFFGSGAPGEVKTFSVKPGEAVVIPSPDGRGGVTFFSGGGPGGGFTSMFTSTTF
ncbi:small nuclear ribonucleoprotein-associated protein B-like [Bacillus rossius redtenbacheri]|uniref:small nuclear ribonucleoprotein-associated protein B-like n=1 Tax=Bacillus rossius redtenbacheri TaxID=93214 RepID=UPI002FDCB077